MLRPCNKAVWAAALGASLSVMQSAAFANGSETLGPPSIPIQNGTQILAAGTGMVSQPGGINIAVPAGASIKQVLLYWAGRDNVIPPVGDNEVVVNGNSVTGATIGSVNRTIAFRADITSLGLINNGNNALTVENMAFGLVNDGAGVMVIVDDGSGGTIQLRDGVDQAYALNPPPGNTTAPQTFTFAPATINRVANLSMFFGSVAGTASSGGTGVFRPSAIEVTVGGQPPVVFNNLLDSLDGEEWDTLNLPINIPAGASQLTVQALSTDNVPIYPDPADDWKVASFNWITAGLSVPPGKCAPCDGKVTTLTLRYQGTIANAQVQVVPKHSVVPVFSGTVQPNELFSFSGNDKFGTLGTDIVVKVNGAVNANIHTSCSQPIGPGLVSGDFLVVAGSSRNGGALCPIDQTPPPPPPPPPSGKGEGCTPGYWKQSQHFDSWPAAYTPNMKFSYVFENAFPGKTLLEVLNLGGGGLEALGRHTVAALLNAKSGSVNYGMTASEVINAFNYVFPGGNYETLKSKFEGFNERGCPLN